MLMCSTPIFALNLSAWTGCCWPCIYFWLAQGCVDVFHTHVCVKVGLPGLDVVTTPLCLGLPCSWSSVITVHSMLIYATSLTASMALVVDHAFLTKLALRLALCDAAFIDIRISYEPDGMLRLCSRQYSHCELSLQPAATITSSCTFYFVSGTLWCAIIMPPAVSWFGYLF